MHPHAQDFEKNTRDRSIVINRFREGSKNQLIVHYFIDYLEVVIVSRKRSGTTFTIWRESSTRVEYYSERERVNVEIDKIWK